MQSCCPSFDDAYHSQGVSMDFFLVHYLYAHEARHKIPLRDSVHTPYLDKNRHNKTPSRFCWAVLLCFVVS